MNFIFDWDGTLGGKNSIITPKSILALNKLKKMGHNIVIATARHPMEILAKTKNVPYIGKYIIGGNGSLIYDIAKSKMIFIKSIPHNYVKEIVTFVRDREDFLKYTNETNAYMCHFSKTKKCYELSENIPVRYANEDDYAKLNGQITFFELRFLVTSELNDYCEKFRKKYGHSLFITTSDDYYITITNKNVNKWTGIQWLLNHINNTNKVIAFGDSMNDYVMIKSADIGVVMGNGIDEIKSVADKVIGHCDDGSILKFVEELEQNPNIFKNIGKKQ